MAASEVNEVVETVLSGSIHGMQTLAGAGTSTFMLFTAFCFVFFLTTYVSSTLYSTGPFLTASRTQLVRRWNATWQFEVTGTLRDTTATWAYLPIYD